MCFAKSLKLRWGHTDPRPLVGRETHSIAAKKRGVDWHSMQNAFRRPLNYSNIMTTKKRTSDVMLVGGENLRLTKTFGEIGLDVLF